MLERDHKAPPNQVDLSESLLQGCIDETREETCTVLDVEDEEGKNLRQDLTVQTPETEYPSRIHKLSSNRKTLFWNSSMRVTNLTKHSE